MKNYRLWVFWMILDSKGNCLIIQKHGYSKDDRTVIWGWRESDEDILDNLRREIYEETWCEKDNYELLWIWKNKHTYEYPTSLASTINWGTFDGQAYDICVIRIKSDAIDKLSFDTTEIRTHKRIKIEDMETYLYFPNQFENFKQALESVVSSL